MSSDLLILIARIALLILFIIEIIDLNLIQISTFCSRTRRSMFFSPWIIHLKHINKNSNIKISLLMIDYATVICAALQKKNPRLDVSIPTKN